MGGRRVVDGMLVDAEKGRDGVDRWYSSMDEGLSMARGVRISSVYEKVAQGPCRLVVGL